MHKNSVFHQSLTIGGTNLLMMMLMAYWLLLSTSMAVAVKFPFAVSGRNVEGRSLPRNGVMNRTRQTQNRDAPVSQIMRNCFYY